MSIFNRLLNDDEKETPLEGDLEQEENTIKGNFCFCFNMKYLNAYSGNISKWRKNNWGKG